MGNKKKRKNEHLVELVIKAILALSALITSIATLIQALK